MPFFNQRVPENFTGTERLDKYISSLENSFNRSKLKSGVHEILVNGNAAKLSSKVRAGDQIDIQWEDNIPDNIEPENIPLNIIFENEDVTVVNKEQGMVTHPAAGNWNGTLVNALLYHWRMEAVKQINDGETQEILERRRPGIVHRLDKDTSGVIITAKNRNAEEWLRAQFQERQVEKEYIVIVRGCPPKRDGVIDTFIVRDTTDRKRFKALDSNIVRLQRFGEDVERYANKQEDAPLSSGKRAITQYHVVVTYGNYSFLRVNILTGRTHQIRVHMKFLGCPVLGDQIYSKKDNVFPNAPLMLHSRVLKIRLSNEKEPVTFKAAIPQRFKEILSTLKQTYPREHLSKSAKKGGAKNV